MRQELLCSGPADKERTMDIHKINLSSRELQVIYIALSKVWWSGQDAEADISVRTKLEKSALNKTGRSVHDFLVEHEAINDTDKPDVRTKAQKAASLKREHKRQIAELKAS